MAMNTQNRHPHPNYLTSSSKSDRLQAMKISNSLEWDTVRRELKATVLKLPYDTSVRHMMQNIDLMVSQLSKVEVEARRTKVGYYRDEQLAKINAAINDLVKILTLAILMS